MTAHPVHVGAVAAVLFIASVSTPHGGVQTVTGAGPTSVGATEQQQIVEELRAIRQILQEITKPRPTPDAAPPERVKLVGLKGYSLGSSAAPLTLVEFSDLQCPFCREFATDTFASIKRDWIDTGKLLYISRDLPLAMHQLAMSAARAARCGGDQGRFWEMRAALFSKKTDLSRDSIMKASADIGLDQPQFSQCYANGIHEAEIRADLAEAGRLGLRGTPTFVLGRQGKDDTLEGLVIIGAQPYAVFEGHLRRLLGDSDH